MSDKPKFSGLTKIRVNGAIGTQKEWKELAASKTGLTVDEVALAIRSAGSDEFTLPEGIDRDKAKVIATLTKAAKSDFKAAKEMQDQINADRAAEAERLKKQAAEMDAAFKAQTENAIVVADDFVGNLNNVVSASVEEYFAVDGDGNFILKNKENAQESFAAGFARLKTLFDKSRQLGGGFALYEAKLALAAEKQFGDAWPNFFASSDEGDVRRITRNVKALKTFEKYGIAVADIPMGVLIVLTEVKYDREDADNNDKIKKEVIETYLAKSKEKGGFLNQKEALGIVNQATPDKRANAAQKWNYVYIYGDGSVRGSSAYDEKIDAVLVIDKNQRIVSKKEGGGFEYKSIPSLTGEQADKDAAEQAQTLVEKTANPAVPAPDTATKKAAKKTATKKAATPPPAAPAAPAPEPAAPDNVIEFTSDKTAAEDTDSDEVGSLDDILS